LAAREANEPNTIIMRSGICFICRVVGVDVRRL